MDNPVEEIRDVVRSITEPYEATVLASNVRKYFTADATIEHPFLNQPASVNGRDDLEGIYKMLRVMTVNNKIDFHAVMFNEDMTQGALDLTEWVNLRWNPFLSAKQLPARFLVRIDLKKCEDGKYRIWRQQDNFPSDLTQSGQARLIPGLSTFNTILKATIAIMTAKIGRVLLSRGWLGP